MEPRDFFRCSAAMELKGLPYSYGSEVIVLPMELKGLPYSYGSEGVALQP